MASKQEIVDALRQVNQRLDGMKAEILANAETPLLSGTWKVRDALCHLAARSNGVPNFITRLERAATAAPGAPATPLPNIDDINQGQIDARVGRSAEELVQEVHEGHLTAIDSIFAMPDDVFERDLPNPRDGSISKAGDTLLRSTSNHDNTHMDEIEQAIAAVRA